MLRERVTKVWATLIAATCVSTWVLSEDGVSPDAAVVGIFVIAALKVRYVLLDFMELRGAPRPVRLFFEFWAAAAAVVILAFWFAAR
jgi:heme/copper-type cytochrome/quinol oxidase subunit 4